MIFMKFTCSNNWKFKHNKWCLLVTCITLLVATSNRICAQLTEQYKEKIPQESFEWLLTKEREASEASDPLKSAELFERIGKVAIELDEDLGIQLLDKAMEAAQAASSDSMIARIWTEGSVPFINKGKYEIASSRLAKAYDLLNSSGDSLNLAYYYIIKGYFERSRGQHYLALDNLHKAKAIQSKLLKPAEMWNVTNRIMINHSNMGNYEAALEIAEQYLEQVKEHEHTRGSYLITMNASGYHLKLENYKKSKEYINIVMPSLRRSAYPKYLAKMYSRLSRISTVEGDFELAHSYADSSIIYAEQFDTPNAKAIAYLRKFQTLKNLNKEKDQLQFLNKGYVNAVESKIKSNILWAAELFAEYENSKSNYKSAFAYLALADSLRQEIFSEELTTQLDELEKRLLLEKSQEEIDTLNDQNKLKQQNLAKAARLRRFLLGFLVLALGACGLIYLLLRQRSKYNKTLEEKNETISRSLSEKELLLREIHHRVKNNLQFISSLLRLQSDHVTDPTALGALKDGHDRVRSMALIHQDLYKEDNLTGVDAQSYFSKLIIGLFKSSNNHEDQVQLALDIEPLNLDVDTIIPIGLITNELVTNSLKYAFPKGRKGKITVGLKEKDKQLILSVSDDGIGIPQNLDVATSNSFGYKLIQALTGQIQGTLKIDRSEGTFVHITIGKYEKV